MTRARVFDFDRAIVRQPGNSVIDGLRDDPSATPDFDGVLKEHAAYVAALRAVGVEVEILPSLEAFPDSMFVEDPALAFGDGAIALRPGAPSRLGETAEMRSALERNFPIILELQGNEYVDGGDVMVTPDFVFIGLSKRTTHAGAEALIAHLARLGRKGKIAQTPASILHFKTASSLLSEDTVLATKAMAGSGVFDGFKIILTPDGEEAAANALRVNDIVLVGDRFPRTVDLLIKEGFRVQPLPVTEIGKLDAGLSCMSLRWKKTG